MTKPTREAIWGWMVGLLLAALVASCVCGCMPAPAPIPVPPTPTPVPPPPTPTPPPAPSGLTRDSFAAVTVGNDAAEALKALPTPDKTVPITDSLTILAWRLDEERPEGGRVWWEVHVDSGGQVVASFAW